MGWSEAEWGKEISTHTSGWPAKCKMPATGVLADIARCQIASRVQVSH